MFIVIFAILYFISSTFLCPDCIRINLRACKTKKIPWEEPQTPCSGALTCAPHALRARGILLPTFSSTPIWQFLDTPLLYGTVRYSTVLYCTVRYCTVLFATVWYGTVLYCTVLYGTLRYCTVLYGTVRYCTVLYCTDLYCIDMVLSLP